MVDELIEAHGELLAPGIRAAGTLGPGTPRSDGRDLQAALP